MAGIVRQSIKKEKGRVSVNTQPSKIIEKEINIYIYRTSG